jgi:hypothetical protein
MADAKELIQWALNSADDLLLEIDDSVWVKSVSSRLTDVSAHIQVEGKIHSGYGFGETPDLALTKAIAEAVERAVIKASGFMTSNGIAAHTDFAAAKRGAEEELRERDLILCHFYTRTPFEKLSLQPAATSDLDILGEWLQEHRVELLTFSLGTGGVLIVADGRKAKRPFGFILGASRKTSTREAFNSAAIEALRQASIFLAGNKVSEPMSLKQFEKLKAPGFSDHGQLALDMNYANEIASLFDGKGRPHETPHEVFVEEVIPELSILKSGPLRFARATCNRLQDMHLGFPTRETINLARLEEFNGKALDINTVLRLPHPFN